ncbi:TPA: toxin VasX [Photobacterium damselae subsp. damselae]
MANKKSLSQGVACDGKKIFIEVSGINHAKPYGFEFIDPDNKSCLDKKKLETTETFDSTTVFSWDWSKDKDKVNIHLQLEGEEGTISLPLFHHAKPTLRQNGEQAYKLMACVPLVNMPALDIKEEGIAPVRSGFLYLYYQGKVWREIVVSSNKEGEQPTFQDIDLSQYRDDNGEFDLLDTQKRQPSGPKMETLWLPEKENGKKVNVGIAYSEMQWSSAHLSFTENDKKYAKERFESVFKQTHLANEFPSLRQRMPGKELMLAEPARGNQDLSGKILEDYISQIKENEIGLATNNATVIKKFEKQYDFSEVCHDYALREQVLRLYLDKTESTAIEQDWVAEESVDYFTYAKQHKYQTIVFNDPQFNLRNKCLLLSAMSQYIQQLTRYTDTQTYAKVALAVNEVVSPYQNAMGGENPMAEYQKYMDTTASGLFDRTLRLKERQLLSAAFITCQQQLMEYVNTPLYGAALRDLTSLDGINGWVGFSMGFDVIGALGKNIAKLDPYNKTPSSNDARASIFALSLMQDDSTQLFHDILFLPLDSVDMTVSTYIPPNALNDGSGFATAARMADIATNLPELDGGKLEHPDLFAIANSVGSSPFFDFSNFRRSTTVAGTMLGELFQTLLSLQGGIAAGQIQLIHFTQAFSATLALAKALDPKGLGQITLQSFNGRLQKGTVIGFQYLNSSSGFIPHGATPTMRSGEVYDRDGTLLLTSSKNKSGIPNAKKTSEMMVAVVPEDSELAKPLNNSVTNKAVNYPRVAKVYQKLRVPYFLTMIELVNLNNARKALDIANDPIYSGTNFLSAITDLSAVAGDTYLFMIQNQTPLRRRLETVVTQFDFWLFDYHFSGVITVLKYVSIVGGVLTAALAAWDALRAWDKNDKDAAFAAGMLASGTAVTTLATTFYSSLFMGGPIGWFGLAIAIAGGLGCLWFKDRPIESWLANGPFGKDKEARFRDEYAVLEDPKQALMTWLNFIIGIKVTVYPMNKVTGQLHLSADVLQRVKAKPKTHCIHIATNLPIALNEKNITIEAVQAIKETQLTLNTAHTSTKLMKLQALSPEGITSVGNSFIYFVNAPKLPEKKPITGMRTQTLYEEVVLVKARVTYQGTVFPLPSLDKDKMVINQYAPSKVNFTQHQDEWADNLEKTVG